MRRETWEGIIKSSDVLRLLQDEDTRSPHSRDGAEAPATRWQGGQAGKDAVSFSTHGTRVDSAYKLPLGNPLDEVMAMPQTRGVVLGNTLLFIEGLTNNPDSQHTHKAAGWAWMPEGLYVVQRLTKEAVRRYLMYWDFIGCPYNKDTYVGVTSWGFPYSDLLQSEGILRFVPVENPFPPDKIEERGQGAQKLLDRLEQAMESGDHNDQLLAADRYQRTANLATLQSPFKMASSAAEILNRSGNGESWSLGYDTGARRGWVVSLDSTAPGEPWTSAMKSNQKADDILTLSLVNALPIPAPNAPLETILEFRIRRRPELLAFRAALDDLYDRIANSTDPGRSLAAAIETIERELGAVHTVFSEHWTAKGLDSLRAYLSLDQPDAGKIAVAAAGAMGAHFVHLPTAIGALAGLGINACLTFEKRRRMSPLDSLSGMSRDFAYLYYVEQVPR